jgi:ring-1,2-phenylacetyl-CoA epoxidase subunit PaaD
VVAAELTTGELWAWLDRVPDPEIPVLSITDLGIVRDVHIAERIVVGLAPTYSGCPATEAIEQSVRDELRQHGFGDVVIERRLSPPWTTDWITPRGRERLLAYGIAPPALGKRAPTAGDRPAACPRCGSDATSRVSEFGSTPCKAAWRCRECLEPFEYFKCL